MECLEGPTPPLLEVSSFLFDLELVHDLGVLVANRHYVAYRFTPSFWEQRGRPVADTDRVKARRIVLGSPLVLELIFGGAAAVWALVQVAEKVSNWRLNRQKLRLEIGKLEAEAQKAEFEGGLSRESFEGALHEKNATGILQQLAERLEGSYINVVDVTILNGKQ